MRLRASWAIVLLLVAALEFVPSYSGANAPLLFVVAAIAPFLLVRLGILARVGAFGSGLLVIVLALAGAWWALRATGPSGLRVLSDAVPRLLTAPRPAAAEAALLAPTALLIALVATLVAVCVLAPAPENSTRVGGMLAPIIGAVVLYVAAQLLDAGRSDPHGIVAMSLLLVAALGWSVPYRHGGVLAGVSWSPSAVVPLVCVVLVGAGVAAIVPSANAFEPRKHVTPPTVHLDQPSPLGLLSSWGLNPNAEILQVKATGTQRLHLATLSDFTGAAWQVDDSYHQFGTIGAPDLPPGRVRATATATVKLTRLSGLWLPSPGAATQVSVPDALTESDDGGLARLSGLTPGLTYDVRAGVDAPTAAALQAAPVPKAVPARYLALPHLPTGLAQYAQEAIRGASTPLEEAVALEHAVSTGRRLSAKAPTGSSYARLTTFLFDQTSRSGAQEGTSEQFAAAFAVLARVVGLPTRVVVGFVLEPPGANGTSIVRGRDAQAWPEVYFSGVGWVAFEPTPGDGASSGDAAVRESVLTRLAGNAAVVPAPANASKLPLPAPTAHKTAAPAAGPSSAHDSTATVLLVGLPAGIVLILLLLFALRSLRAARHRRRGARGAWAEVLDLLVLAGRTVPRSAPAPEVADGLDVAFAGPGGGARVIAVAADRAAFAPVSSDSSDAPPELWRHVRVLRRRVRTGLPWHRRMTFPVDPRPLLRR